MRLFLPVLPATGPFLAVIVLAGCAKPTLKEECQKQFQVTCNKLFECNRAVAESIYTNQDGCFRSLSTLCNNYEGWVCDDLTAYDQCINDTANRSCSGPTPSSCENGDLTKNCRPGNTNGRTTCSSTNTNTNGSTCSVTLSSCSDGRSYVLSCSGSSCTCNDGSNTRTFTGSCGDRSQAINVCGWNVN
jgi:hypothetical protein